MNPHKTQALKTGQRIPPIADTPPISEQDKTPAASHAASAVKSLDDTASSQGQGQHKDRGGKTVSGASARLVAAHALVGVLNKKLPLETALSKQEAHTALSARDRAFARLIAATSLRRLGQIDGALKPFLKQIPPALVHNLIRTAVAQMLFLETPPHAAVGETVAILKMRANTKGFSGMANAILRRVSEKGAVLSAAIAPQENIPSWLRKSWERAYGRSDMRRMAKQLLLDPPLDITVKDNPEKWANALEGTLLPTGTIRLKNIGDVTALPGFDDGAWWVQDIAASLPVKLSGVLKDKSVLDMCAAPGGKTLQLAAAGANVTALDRSEHRMLRVSENLKRAKLSADIVISDALEYVPILKEGETEGYDLILLDAPCSATGTYRRHPDVIYNKSHNDIQSLVKIQDALLRRAAQWVRPGGMLIYCTCSLQIEEGEGRANKFLQEMSEFRLIPILEEDVPSMPDCVQSEGYYRSRPHVLSEFGGMDGFFIVRFQRVG